MATSLIQIPKARNDRQLRRVLRGEIRYYATKARLHAEHLRDSGAELDADDHELASALDRVADLVDAGVDVERRSTDETIEFVSLLAALVAEGDHRACALDLAKALPANLYERVEPSAAVIGHAAMFAYARWAVAIEPALLDEASWCASYSTMHAIERAIADGIVHARDASSVPEWLRTELASAIGRTLDAGDMPTRAEYIAGNWFNKAALDAVREVARTWVRRADASERATMRRARSRSSNALLARVAPQLELLPDLPCFADWFEVGHAYGLVERLLDEIAEAQDVVPVRSLDAPLWFSLLTEDVE